MPIQGVYTDNYMPVGDILTMAVCYVIIIVMFFSFIKRTRSFRVFLIILLFLILASITNVAYYTVLKHTGLQGAPIAGALRLIMHASLFIIFFLFTRYIAIVTDLTHKVSLWSSFIGGIITCFVIIWDLIDTLDTRRGFRITEAGIQTGTDVFMIGYIAYVILLGFLLIYVRNRIYKRVLYGYYYTVILAVALNLIQHFAGQSSLTVGSFLLPVVAMFYIMHSNPYDVRLGSINISAMDDMIRFYREKKIPFGYMSLFMHTFSESHTSVPASMQETIRRFSSSYFRDARLFHVSSGHFLLIFSQKRNPDYQERISSILKAFTTEHARFRQDYKIVIGSCTDQLSNHNEYISFIRNIHRNMEENSIHFVTEKDSADYDRAAYILRELTDIYRVRRLDDPRVLVYCQPVYNIRLGRYDTAEALMRLNLKETGIVYPDQFIHLAEENGYIHVLTQIILHKTCEAVRTLIAEGYSFTRISVNVSALELKDQYFCRDITGIIEESEIPGNRVAIELTESQDESDFLIMQQRINELKDLGIKFYLDDFGTGYSSLERIMQLPFDIIKFDRSLVIASASNSRSAQIVSNMARLFAEMDFSVLYEGVEDTGDEQRCIGMSASYLQGYKYSRPVPIDEMRHFFSLSA
ncbi:MAG: EAL domain-containing protein [Clostridia bacterium]|nr:EAL domain-containing protein [Clostridia bacterium]